MSALCVRAFVLLFMAVCSDWGYECAFVYLCPWWNLRWNSWLCMCEWPFPSYQMSDVRNISLLLLWVVVISQFYDWIEVSCCSGFEADSWTDKIINRQIHVFVNVHNLALNNDTEIFLFSWRKVLWTNVQSMIQVPLS